MALGRMAQFPFSSAAARRCAAAAVVAISGLCLLALPASAQDGLNQRIIQSGHSLTDPIVGPLRAFAIAAGASPNVVVDGSTIPGSTLDWRWANEPWPGTPNARTDIGNYDLLVLTERSSLANTMPYHDTLGESLRWFDNAFENGAGGAGARTILYATWVNIDSGPEAENPYGDPEGNVNWRDRLPLEFARWVEIADYVNANRPDGSSAMKVIPATLVLAAAYDDIQAGAAPGISDLQDLFVDNIHLNDAGAYLIALAHYAVIYDRDPRGLPANIGLPQPVSPEQASWMQSLVWDVVSTYRTLSGQREAEGATLTAEAFEACLWRDLRHAPAACS